MKLTRKFILECEIILKMTSTCLDVVGKKNKMSDKIVGAHSR